MLDEDDLNNCIDIGNDSTSITQVEYSVNFSRVLISLKDLRGITRKEKRKDIWGS